jgi:HD-GYP domain-containing protein (c-di-GMP phosphodiesterase class II)
MKRVAVHSRRIAENMKLDLKIIESIYYGALIHDIGKLIINETILNKPGDLKDTEFREMAAHVTCGMRISERINNSIIKNIITLHHEKTDGTGYPFKYKSSQIPIEAKIVSVADVWDALTSERPYKKAFSKEDARNKMINDYNSFDEIVLNVFFDSKNNLFQLET